MTKLDQMKTVKELRRIGLEWEEIAKHFERVHDIDYKADYYRINYSYYLEFSEDKNKKLWLLSEEDKPKQRIVGVIGDVHLPFEHRNYLLFVTNTFIKWGVTDVVFAGDITDHHSISRHATEVVADGGLTEFEKTYAKVQEWAKEFPVAKYCLGNHCLIPERQAATLGLHHGFVKSFSEQWNLPNTWEVADSHIIDNVYYFHGIGSGGILNSINYAKELQMSIVLGHKHSASGVRYQASPNNLVFAMDVGCGIDVHAYAFNYGKAMVKKPILSCGIVVSDKEAYTIPMTEEYFN